MVNDLHLILNSPHDKLVRKAIETVYKVHNIEVRTFDFKNSSYSDIDDLLLNRVPTNVIEFDPYFFLEYLEKTGIESLKRVGIWAILPTDVSLCDPVILSLKFALELKIPIYFLMPQVESANWNKIVPQLSPESVEVIKRNQRKSFYFTPIDFSDITHLSAKGMYTSLIRSTYRRPQALSSKIIKLLSTVSTILINDN
jgi:hypothetical protein